MGIFTSTFTATALATTLLGLSYNYQPWLYARVACTTGWLPLTTHIKQTAHGELLGCKLNSLDKSAAKFRINKNTLRANRREIDARIDKYQSFLNQTEILLVEAQNVLHRDPSATEYLFRARRYKPVEFRLQIETIQQQLDSQTASLGKLFDARKSVESIWLEVISQESNLAADSSLVKTALLKADTQEMLEGVSLDIDNGAYKNSSEWIEFKLRTVDELLQEDALRG